jgi:hypothetical protein
LHQEKEIWATNNELVKNCDQNNNYKPTRNHINKPNSLKKIQINSDQSNTRMAQLIIDVKQYEYFNLKNVF